LWVFYLVFGLLSAAIGIYIGKTSVDKTVPVLSSDKKTMSSLKSREQSSNLHYSLTWLALNFLGMITVLLMMNFLGLLWWLLTGLSLIVIWALRYKSALRPLLKPKFWIFFVTTTMLSSYLFAQFQSTELTIADGLLIGLQMNFRAALMIVGFSVIGKELSNPVIRNFFLRTSFRQLPLALEIAFETLPFVIANLPSIKDIFRKPVGVTRQIVAQSEFWLQKVALTMKKKSNVVIITGEIGSGKTSLLKAISLRLKESGIKTGGILAPAIFENSEKKGYNLIDLTTNKTIALSQTEPNKGMAQVGKYYFKPDAIVFGRKALSVEQNLENEIVIIDEIGAWELQGQGWGASLNELIINSNTPLILSVRKKFLDMVIESWMLQNPLLIDAKDASVDEVLKTISGFTCLKTLNSTNH